MKTALQLRDGQGDAPRCELLWGEPLEVLGGPLGPILVFGAGAIVAYVLQSRRRRHLFVFRTLEVDDPLAASVPGVRPRVQLLLDLVSAGRVRLVRGLFAYLMKTGRAPSDLPDDFYVRISAVLCGRLPGHKILRSLLPPSTTGTELLPPPPEEI
ncbi:MAG TPA: hypothetical protein VGM06_22075 [Polyangiaceae bacterium]|jgi:hypothetical protein